MAGSVITTYEVDADGGDVGLGVGVVGESQQQARLADTGVTDEQQLEEVVVSGIFVSGSRGGCVQIDGRRRVGGSREGRSLRRQECQQQTKAAARRQAPAQAGDATGDALLGIHLGQFVLVLRGRCRRFGRSKVGWLRLMMVLGERRVVVGGLRG
jgi:hypothetical protein